MPQIIDSSYFNKQNDLFIPVAGQVPVSYPNQATPNNTGALDSMSVEVERSLLLNAFGLELYNELQTALEDLDNADQKWKDLVNGVAYDGKVWEGLKNDKSLIAYAVYCAFLSTNSDFYTALGVARPESENAKLSTPAYKIASASQAFGKKYQGGLYRHPRKYECYAGTFTDWYGSENEIEVSLFQYLRDKKDVYEWEGKFRFYEIQNSFGI